MNLLRKFGSTLVIAGLVLMVAAPAVSNGGAGGQADQTEVVDETGSADEAAPIATKGEDPDAAERSTTPATSKRDLDSACPTGQGRVVQGNHMGQCVATAEAGQTSVASATSGAATAQTVIKKVVIQIVQRSCEVRNGISETNVTFSFRHNGLNTTDRVELTINGPTGVIVISEKTEFELPEGTYSWTARSIDSGYEVDGPSSGQLVVLACQTGSTTTSSTTTTTSSTTTTVPVSATTITSPTTTSSSTTSSTTSSTSTSSTSTTSSSTTSTTVPDDECEPPDCLPYTGPSDVSWPLGIFGLVLLVLGMGTLTISRTIEERQMRLPVQ